MATFTAVRNKKQTASAMANVMEYVTQGVIQRIKAGKGSEIK